MPSVQESFDQTVAPMTGVLDAGLDSLDLDQVVTFVQYQRVVLPLDGFVFWLNTGLTQSFMGSLHYSTNLQQDLDETAAVNSVLFSAKEPVRDLEEVAPNQLWVATKDSLKFAFARRAPFYEQAGIYHYTGEAVNPSMQTQLVDDPAAFDDVSPVVSNSLPFWLALVPPYTVDPLTTALLSYPSADPGNGTPYWDGGVFSLGTGTATAPSGLTAELLAYPSTDPGNGTPYWNHRVLCRWPGAPPAVSVLTAHLLNYTYGPNTGGMPFWDGGVFSIAWPRVAPSVFPGLEGIGFTLFPSFLVPNNLPPPYGVVHIDGDTIEALQAAPQVDPMSTQWQLAKERVEVTLYGVRSDGAHDFISYVSWYSLISDTFGLMNVPVVQDQQRTQVELGVLGMKKKITFEIDYLQSRARAIARQLILQASLRLVTQLDPL